MKTDFIKNNKGKIKDLTLSISATVMMNVVIQFVIYPQLERGLGEEQYGVTLSILSIIAIFASTLGSSANYSRMVTNAKADIEYTNGDYNIVLLPLSALCGLGGIFYLRYLGITSVLAILFFLLLTVLTVFRYYSDVAYRMKGDFVRYMIFYALISVGYIIGMLIYRLTDEWMLALICGEGAAIVFSFFTAELYRKDVLKPSKNFLLVCKSMAFLMLSSLIESLTLNADRLLLMVFSGGVAVSIYYVASLIGKIIAMLSTPINSIIISYLVKYEGKLTKKFWAVSVIALSALGVLAFLGCMIIAPFLLKILYPDLYPLAKPHVPMAMLGQIFYFISGILLVILLKFCGEKNQFLFNLGYAIEFLVIVIAGTYFGELEGFVYSSLAANAIRFAAVIIWGIAVVIRSKKEPKRKNESA